MSLDDFCGLDPQEFGAILKAYADQRDADRKDEWQRMRLLATITVAPHLDRKHGNITPEKLLPLPWDKEGDLFAPKMSRKEQRKRMDDLFRKFSEKK